MANKITTTITMTPEVHDLLKQIALHQRRSRSNTIESLVIQYYNERLAMPAAEKPQVQHKAITIQGV